MPSPFIHTERPVTGPCRKLLARYFGSLGSSQSQRPAERRVPRSFYCSSTPESEREGIVPLYDIFVTQRAPLGSECPETVLLCFPTAAISSRGVQPQVLRILCFSTAASSLTPGWRGVTQFSFCGPSFARGVGERDPRRLFHYVSSLSRQKPRSLFPSSSEEEAGFDPGSDSHQIWKRERYH